MTGADDQMDTLRQRIAELERENRLLREGVTQADRMRHLWEQALAELTDTKKTLEARNEQLASLYRVASAMTRCLSTEELFEQILDAMEGVSSLARGRATGLFLVEEDRMRLVASRGSSPEFLAAHEGMRVGDCLCGRVAQDGEMIVTRQCQGDARHTIQYPGFEPHGHLILPLVSGEEEVVGVFYYYLPPDYDLLQRELDTFVAIGQQLGLAIERARLYDRTREMSMHDPLTGLWNRRYMEIVLERDIGNARRYQGSLAAVMADLDHFKDYNDRYGHPAGDRLLAEVADLLCEQVRGGDLVVRYGGEEYLMLLPQCDEQTARAVAERVRAVVEERTPVTISLGVAVCEGEACAADALIEAADRALYQAKDAGRNCVMVAP